MLESLFSQFSIVLITYFIVDVNMDPLPPSASQVPLDDSLLDSTPDPMNSLADLTSDCQLDPEDPLQHAMDQAFGDENADMDFDGHGSRDSSGYDPGSPPSCMSSSVDSSSVPCNQEGPWPRHDPRPSLYHDTNPIAVKKAAERASELAASAQKIHDVFIGQGMEKHDFPEVTDESLDLEVIQSPISGPFRITIPELVLSRSVFNRTFAVYGTTLDFVLTTRRSERHPWYIPPLVKFTEVINTVQGRIIEKRFRFLDVLVETKGWCGVGVFSLKATCPLRLQRWRTELTRFELEGYEFNSFPKDALITKNIQVSILLRSGLKNFKLHLVPHELKIRNPLKGKIAIVYSKTYGPQDKTRAGFSKNGWRLVIANVDAVFVESLKLLPFGYGFRIGASTAQIRLLSSAGEPDLPPLGGEVNPDLQVSPPSTHDRMVQHVHDQLRFENAHFRQQQMKDVAPFEVPPTASREIPQEEVDASTLPALKFPMVPDLVKAISFPLPHDQVKPKTGPGSRGGKRAKNIAAAAASAVARKALNSVMGKK